MRFLVFLILVINSMALHSQGCSDAGFCSINGMNPASHIDSTDEKYQSLELGITNGIAQFGVYIANPYLQYSFDFTEKITVSTKVNYAIISGSLTSNNGLSDLFTSVNYKFNKSFSMINGVKTPFNNANNKYQDYSMPMSYQTTLGTVDYLFGLTYKKEKYLISVGLQQPIIQNNNAFFTSNLTPFGLDSNYISTNRYIRKSDVLIRFNYMPSLSSEKVKLTVGLLAIQHIANDEFTDIDGIQKEIVGSKGLTLNVNAITRIALNQKSYLDFTLGVPVMSRDKRPDGLSQLAVNVAYGINLSK